MRRALLLFGLCLMACSPDDAPPATPVPAAPADPVVELRQRITSTFGDEQAKALFKEFGERLHHPLSGGFGFHVYAKIVRVPAETVSPTLQFLVQLVQKDIAEEW